MTWKKIPGFDSWSKDGDKDSYPRVDVGRGYYNSSEKGWQEKYPFSVTLINYFGEEAIASNVKTKSEAIKLAKEYMKRWDAKGY
jgi:hypothetical protein